MKTSRILIICLAGILVALLITVLIMFRRDIHVLLENQELIEYTVVPSEKFVSLDFSDNWSVNIKQGKDCKVELAIDESIISKPDLDNRDGILYLSIDSISEKANSDLIHVRITAPVLHVIKASGDTKIQLKNFWSDSLTVVLEDNSTFSGRNNDFATIKFKASGNEE
ncbi:MAG: DUF2807 domain-containing protein [Bacteroidales bacterium]|jgi:hypothetical protein